MLNKTCLRPPVLFLMMTIGDRGEEGTLVRSMISLLCPVSRHRVVPYRPRTVIRWLASTL